MKTVLVTRPRPVALSLTQRLGELGYQTFAEPILSLVPLFSVLQGVPKNVAVVFTSRLVFSVLAVRRSEVEPFFDCPCYCVGSQTGAQARAFGFKKVYVGEGDGQGLARLILDQEDEDRPLLHIGGEDVSHELYDRLSAAGRSVIHKSVYKSETATSLTEALQKELKEKKIDAVLLYSPRTAGDFVKLLQEAGLEACCASLTAIGLSEAVIVPLRNLPFRRILVSDQPTEESVLSTLCRILPVS